MAPPYRKACYSCIKGKRRCDLGSPKCQRCTKRGLVCDYKGKSSGNQGLIFPDSPVFDTIGGDNNIEAEQPLDMTDNLPYSSFNGNDSSALETDTVGLAQLSSWPPLNTLEEYTMESLEGGIRSNFTSSTDNLEWIPTSTAAEANMATDYDIPVIPFEPDDTHVVSENIYHARVQYALRLFKTFPNMFVKAGKTPFIHRQLYREVSSDTIQDALSCCGLYAAKNEQNESLIFADIRRKSNQLINTPQPFQCPMKHLAAIQALILYQVIRLFDGDIRLRAEAEKDFPVLEKWAEQLLLKTAPISSETYLQIPDQMMNTPMISLWDGWIFEESSRRTILTSYMLIGVYSFTKGGFDREMGKMKINRLSFTAQAAIWNAPSSFHWRLAFKERKNFQLKVCDWDRVMEGVQPHDIDELGIILMACFKDLDHICEWLGKVPLEDYQLDSASMRDYCS